MELRTKKTPIPLHQTSIRIPRQFSIRGASHNRLDNDDSLIATITQPCRRRRAPTNRQRAEGKERRLLEPKGTIATRKTQKKYCRLLYVRAKERQRMTDTKSRAQILADDFDTRFRPFTEEQPRVCLPRWDFEL